MDNQEREESLRYWCQREPVNNQSRRKRKPEPRPKRKQPGPQGPSAGGELPGDPPSRHLEGKIQQNNNGQVLFLKTFFNHLELSHSVIRLESDLGNEM